MASPDFSSAKLVAVLDQNERNKYTALHLSMMGSEDSDFCDAVVLAEKTSFPDSPTSIQSLHDILGLSTKQGPTDAFKLIEANDVYYRYIVEIGGAPTVKLTVIHPASPKHIAKYTKQERILVTETPELYTKVVLPYIESHSASRLQWVQNILEEKSEMEALVAVDRDPVNGFYFLPDSKWDRRNLSGLYLLAICNSKAIRSLRDLDGTLHLPLLEGIKRAVHEEVPQKYPGIAGNKLRCFIHYQPTYYHFHVHVVHLDMIDSIGALVGQAHLLDDVIDNLKTFGPDFYKRKSLTYQLGINHDLAKLL